MSGAGIFVYAGLWVGVIYLLVVQLGAGAAMHRAGLPPGAELMGKIDGVVAAAAEGKGVELHLGASDLQWDRNAGFLARIYFSTVYHQYPNAVLIGDGRSIINFPVELRRADRVASDGWLREHGAGSVVTLVPGDGDDWRAIIHRVP